HPSRHCPLDFVTHPIAEEGGPKRGEHRQAPGRKVRLVREHERVGTRLARIEISYAYPRMHRDYIRGHLSGGDWHGANELLFEPVDVLLIPGVVCSPRTHQRA